MPDQTSAPPRPSPTLTPPESTPPAPIPPMPPGAARHTLGMRPAQRWAFGLLAGLIAAAAVWTLHTYLAALVWAAIFAIALWPAYGWVRARVPAALGRGLVPAAFALVVAVAFFLPLVLGAVQAAHEAQSVARWIDHVRAEGIPVPEAVSHLPVGAPQITAWWQAHLASPGDAAHLAGMDRAKALAFGREAGVAVVHRLVLLAFMLLTLFFLLRDGRALSAQMRRAALRAFGPDGERLGELVIAAVRGTVSGLVLVGLGEGLLIGLAYVFAGAPHPVLLGAVTAVAAMVPFAAGIAIALAALLLAAKGAMLGAALVAAWGTLVLLTADHFVRPALIGGATRLPFLLVLLGILGGVESWGLLGLFLGPAIMAALVSLWRQWSAPSGSAPPGSAPAGRVPVR